LRPLLVSCASVSWILLAACQSYESGARESFSKEFTCPGERVTVKERPELKPSQVMYGGANARQPPKEIATDPGRLKIWQAEQDKTTASVDSSCEMWEASGCDHAKLLCCRRPSKHANRVSCSSYDYPPGMAKK
jgi:hypothetical protein